MMQLIPHAVNGFYCPDDPGEPGRGEYRLSVNNTEGQILKEFAHSRYVLEIGTGLGVATRWLAESALWVVTCDIDRWVYDNVSPNLPQNVSFYGCSAHNLPEYDHKFELAFIDAAHDYDNVLADIAEARRRVTQGGLIIMHDLGMDGVRRAIADSKMMGFEILTRAGMGVGWNVEVKQDG